MKKKTRKKEKNATHLAVVFSLFLFCHMYLRDK
ncbi:unnamed protein product [Spirodela intermedia]|uniref:Uncharacterized protein n=1 Tax=Spirodela intermedia TaxID=51605 RepID=A0A7I8K5D6_SPIIN|nr:unnamed protein product [Spirodela intermedia]